jgi:EAL domain-containing protein (putative c-di-GMP-specific phosphodiesterase class I)
MARGFCQSVEEMLVATGNEPSQLALDMTEHVYVEDGERALVVLEDLKRIGVRLALDDFGTGYSSLSYLQRFPLDIVKIDRGFTAKLGHDPASGVIVAAVIDLAHALGKTVVAEGVETSDQHDRLSTLGCDSCQGHYFARPMPVADLEPLFRHGGILPAPAAQ